jgi:hypothetical protein
VKLPGLFIVVGLLEVKVKVESCFLSFALARLRAALIPLCAFASASLTFFSTSYFKL